jgi:mannose-1-phosphate guanylyltransferase
VVVAGGSGTRLWPLSRKNLPKQMQALMSDRTLIVETVDRLRGVIPDDHIFVSTTANYSEAIRDLLPDIPRDNVIVEPEARGTAAAFALFASALHERDPEAIAFSLASDHAITQVDLFQDTMRSCYDFIEQHPEHVALVGIKPTRADTGLGYIKVRERFADDVSAYSVEKFVEKPTLGVAEGYLESGDYYWNAAYYCFATRTLLEAYRNADARLVDSASRYLATGDPADYRAAPRKVHEIELIDSGLYPLVVVPAEFTWSDIGNWQTLHHVMAEMAGEDLVVPNARQHADVNSTTGLVLVPPEYSGIVATAGLDNIAVVVTDDAVLVINLDHADQMPELLKKVGKDHKEVL